MKLIVCNLKTYLNKEDFDSYITGIKNLDLSNVVICPSYIFLDSISKEDITIGSQDVSAYNNNNHTGEITALQLKSINTKYTIVGHSERNETSDIISSKINNLLKAEITPILCIGETLEDRKNNTYKNIINNRLNEVLKGIKKEDIFKIIVAYEPIWAIGSKTIPTNDELEEVIRYIKTLIKEQYNLTIKVLYGGSISDSNIKTLNSIDNLDGYLIGRSSTDIKSLKNILKKVKNTKKDKN